MSLAGCYPKFLEHQTALRVTSYISAGSDARLMAETFGATHLIYKHVPYLKMNGVFPQFPIDQGLISDIVVAANKMMFWPLLRYNNTFRHHNNNEKVRIYGNFQWTRYRTILFDFY